MTLCALCLVSCDGKHLTLKENVLAADTIDVDVPVCDKLAFSKFLDAPETIILETSPQCVIGNIRHIEMFEDKIYILDDVSNNMYVFDKKGNFVHKISNKGGSNKEYVELADFAIDREHGKIFLWDETRDLVLKYDLRTNEYLSTTHVERDGDRSYCIAYQNGILYANHTSLNVSDKNYEVRVINAETGQQQGSLLSSDAYSHGWNQPLRLQHTTFYSKNTNLPKYLGLFSNKVMSITGKGMEIRYVIESENFVNANDIHDMLETLPKNDYIYDLSNLENNDKVYMVSRLNEFGELVSFKFMRGWKCYNAIYNSRTDSTWVACSLVNDYVCSDGKLSMEICYGDENGAVGIIKGDDIPHFKKILDTGCVNAEIHRYDDLKKLDVNSNPILFYHPLKYIHN